MIVEMHYGDSAEMDACHRAPNFLDYYFAHLSIYRLTARISSSLTRINTIPFTRQSLPCRRIALAVAQTHVSMHPCMDDYTKYSLNSIRLRPILFSTMFQRM